MVRYGLCFMCVCACACVGVGVCVCARTLSFETGSHSVAWKLIRIPVDLKHMAIPLPGTAGIRRHAGHPSVIWMSRLPNPIWLYQLDTA